MKKYVFLFVFIVCLAVLVSCAGNIGNGETEATYNKAESTHTSEKNITDQSVYSSAENTTQPSETTTLNTHTEETTSISSDSGKTVIIGDRPDGVPELENLDFSVGFPFTLKLYYPYSKPYSDKLENKITGKYISDYPGKYPELEVRRLPPVSSLEKSKENKEWREKYKNNEITYCEYTVRNIRESISEIRQSLDVYMFSGRDKYLLDGDVNELVYYLDTYIIKRDIGFIECGDEEKNSTSQGHVIIYSKLASLATVIGSMIEFEQQADGTSPKCNQPESEISGHTIGYIDDSERLTAEDIELLLKISECCKTLIGDYMDTSYFYNKIHEYYTTVNASFYFSPRPSVISYYDENRDITIVDIKSTDVSYFMVSKEPTQYNMLAMESYDEERVVAETLNKGNFEIEGKYSGYFYVYKVDDDGVISYDYEYEIVDGIAK